MFPSWLYSSMAYQLPQGISTKPGDPQTRGSCGFSKHSWCILPLFARVSPCLAPEVLEMCCQALSLGQQPFFSIMSSSRVTVWRKDDLL